MSKEKQIEEMARDVCHSIVWDQDGYATVDCLITAKNLHHMGYRKQSEGEWEKRVFIIFDSEKVGYRCAECNTTWDTPTPYCPNCGAKMRKEDEGK